MGAGITLSLLRQTVGMDVLFLEETVPNRMALERCCRLCCCTSDRPKLSLPALVVDGLGMLLAEPGLTIMAPATWLMGRPFTLSSSPGPNMPLGKDELVDV